LTTARAWAASFMNPQTHWPRALPWLATALALGTLVWWLGARSGSLPARVPGTDAAPEGAGSSGNPVLAGKVMAGPGQPAELAGEWPQFRGPNRDGLVAAGGKLARDWHAHPPREIWGVDVGEGYAGAAVSAGRVFLVDYDRDARMSALRALSLADGRELWRFAYPLTIKRNHGMTRTVPAIAGDFVVALDSKCNVLCVDARSGELRWTVNLVREYGATIPEWYAGQCPLIVGDQVILAPGGKAALLLALDLATGKPVWQTPNPRDWKMTHSSIAPMTLRGRAQFVYCAHKGVVGVDAASGALLWETTDWKISIATVPSPVPLPENRIFLTGGYGAGSLTLEVEEAAGVWTAKTLSRLPPKIFGATQHTPILKDGHLYGAREDDRFACLKLDGQVVWASSPDVTFGLGPFLMADDLIYAVNDGGKLRLIEATPTRFQLLGEKLVLSGRESWAPLALAGSRLLVRDLSRLVCLDVGER
jgi:outer membrane protein assembly factor BamB